MGRKFDGHQELIQRLLSEGHEIGNHSYGHYPFPNATTSPPAPRLIEHVAGARPKLFRPPFGAVDRPGAEAAIEDGMRVILWSVDSEDGIPPWKGISAEEITSNVLDHISPGAVVLLHDGLPWSRAADALPELIEGLHGEGYRLVTMSELLAQPDAGPPSLARRVLRRLRARIRRAGRAPRRARGAATDGSDREEAAAAPVGGEDGDRRAPRRSARDRGRGGRAPPEEAEARPAGEADPRGHASASPRRGPLPISLPATSRPMRSTRSA